MKAKAVTRARIARVRRIQHSLAAAAAAQAEHHAAMLEGSAERLAEIRNSLDASEGLGLGATLARLGELAVRLDDARHGLTDALVSARAAAAQQAQARLEARRRQESAAKLEQRAADALAAFLERNAEMGARRWIRALAGDEG